MLEFDARSAVGTSRIHKYERLLNHFERYKKFRQFLRTREAIYCGEKLFEMRAEDLAKREFMGPLAFNLYETTIAALPAAGLAWIFQTIRHTESETMFPKLADGYWQNVFSEMNKFAPTIEHISKAFIVPVLLLVVAVTASWASLHAADSTKETRKRCRDAFLYYDGAYGLLPQMLTSMGLVLFAHMDWIVGKITEDDAFLGLVLSFPLTAAGIWQLYILLVEIPRNLFDLNGYKETANLVAVASAPRPWGKFLGVTVPLTFVGLPVLGFALEYGLIMAFMIFAIAKIWLRTLA